MGSFFLVTGCVSTGEVAVDRPRMVWAGLDQAGEDQVQAGWHGDDNARGEAGVYWAGPNIAVLPVHNLTGLPAPLKELESRVTDALVKSGVKVLKKQVLKEFMTRHRMRYTGGLDERTAPLVRYETGVEAVFVTTLEYYEESDPPKISLHARLISSGDRPEIMWMESVCITGVDTPGLLGVGIVDDPESLMGIAVQRIINSFVLHMAGQQLISDSADAESGIGPTVEYSSPVFKSKDNFTVAVIPFLNLSERPHAGEILPIHFADILNSSEGFHVLEPGVVRTGLLKMRVTLEGGLSKPYLELVFKSTDADLVLTGTVFRYLDSEGPMGEPDVEFSVQIFERVGKEIAWSSRSIGSGNDGLIFFDLGKRRTACEMSAELVRSTIDRISETKNPDGQDDNDERTIH
jgi:hypothetical protein